LSVEEPGVFAETATEIPLVVHVMVLVISPS
jgi:hypothetical protein